MNSTKSIAALFDFDGVVVDTEPQYSIFWNEQGRKYHPEIPEFGRMIKGQTLTQIYNKYFAGMEDVQREITEDLNMFTRSKPDPECFLLGATVFDTVPENCVVFEDSFHGLEAGNRAGMTVIGLATTNPEEQIRDKAKAVIQDFNGFSFEKMKDIMR